MKEYIEREALFKKVLEERRFVFQMEDLLNHELVVRTVYNDFAEFVNSIPAADVVEVVRCKDCQEWKELLLDNLPAGVGDCRCNLMTTDAHFYCASGERRSE